MTRDELIAALECATGPDRELDREIGFLCCGWTLKKGWPAGNMIRTQDGDLFPDSPGSHYPPFTESRDAMLPGADELFWDISDWRPLGGWRASCGYDTSEVDDWFCVGIAATEPLARRIAEIKALIQR